MWNNNNNKNKSKPARPGTKWPITACPVDSVCGSPKIQNLFAETLFPYFSDEICTVAELKLSGLSLNLESFTPFILCGETKIMIIIFEDLVSSKPQQAWGWLYYKSERENVGFYFLPH